MANPIIPRYRCTCTCGIMWDFGSRSGEMLPAHEEQIAVHTFLNQSHAVEVEMYIPTRNPLHEVKP